MKQVLHRRSQGQNGCVSDCLSTIKSSIFLSGISLFTYVFGHRLTYLSTVSVLLKSLLFWNWMKACHLNNYETLRISGNRSWINRSFSIDIHYPAHKGCSKFCNNQYRSANHTTVQTHATIKWRRETNYRPINLKNTSGLWTRFFSIHYRCVCKGEFWHLLSFFFLVFYKMKRWLLTFQKGYMVRLISS